MSVFLFGPALERLLKGPDGPVARELGQRAVRIESSAKLIATGNPKVQTGRYRSSITWRIGADARGLFAQIGSNVKYAVYLEEGTRPHIIRPRIKQALNWPTARHPVKFVRHPGTRAYRVLQRAAEMNGLKVVPVGGASRTGA